MSREGRDHCRDRLRGKAALRPLKTDLGAEIPEGEVQIMHIAPPEPAVPGDGEHPTLCIRADKQRRRLLFLLGKVVRELLRDIYLPDRGLALAVRLYNRVPVLILHRLVDVYKALSEVDIPP